jgi:1-hydroxycarotenoid 3,4-desaturase
LAARRVAVIGAGIAGLTAAMDMARAGFEVTVYERAATPGGKLRQLNVAGHRIDAGPSVFTLREIFDELFDAAGETFDSKVKLIRADVLARHAWDSSEHLDLYADVGRSVDAIARFAGSQEARGFANFAAHARRVYATLEHSFIRASRPTPVGLARRLRFRGIADLWNIQPFVSLWRSASRAFSDPRLRQLFGRYATYCGSSPFLAPATLMLVAHVEQAGVWYVEGGMYELAVQLAAAAERQGAKIRYSTDVLQIHAPRGRVSAIEVAGGERIDVDAVVCNADTNAIATGLFGSHIARGVKPTSSAARSLSAVTWNLVAPTSGFALAHHSVFFCRDYRAEFDDIFVRRRLPSTPTIYICAQDRLDASLELSGAGAQGAERLFCLVNAPATGDSHMFSEAEIDACESQVFQSLKQFGLNVQRQSSATVVTTPSDFNRLFPATGGALYGPASHGWKASFNRPGSRSAVPGLYLAGGSSHPGPGVPMAATSGRLAAACVKADYASIAG